MDAPGVARLGYPHSGSDRVFLKSETEPGLGWSFLGHTFRGVAVAGSHSLGIGPLLPSQGLRGCMSDVTQIGADTLRDMEPEMRRLAWSQRLMCLYSWRFSCIFLGPQTLVWTC